VSCGADGLVLGLDVSGDEEAVWAMIAGVEIPSITIIPKNVFIKLKKVKRNSRRGLPCAQKRQSVPMNTRTTLTDHISSHFPQPDLISQIVPPSQYVN
jgi:hypothetical protein